MMDDAHSLEDLDATAQERRAFRASMAAARQAAGMEEPGDVLDDPYYDLTEAQVSKFKDNSRQYREKKARRQMR